MSEDEELQLIEKTLLSMIEIMSELIGLHHEKKYKEYLELLGTITPKINDFIDKVKINDKDPLTHSIKKNILKTYYFLINNIADFSQIESKK